MKLKPIVCAMLLGAAAPAALFAAPADSLNTAPQANDNINSGGLAQWKSKIKLGGLDKKLKINGFLSAGLSDSNTAAGYGIPNFGTVGNSLRASANTLAGLQFDANITPSLDAVIQVVASGSNRNGETAYNVSAEWAFVRYTLNNGTQLQAGRFRIPTFLYSDTSEVGYSYPWVWLPNEVYRIVPFNNFNAVDANFSKQIGASSWHASVLPMFGSNESKFTVYHDAGTAGLTSNSYATLKFDEDNIMGGVVTLQNPMITLRADYIHIDATSSLDSYSANLTTQAQEIAGVNLGSNKGASFYSFAGRLNNEKVLAIAEYAKRRAFAGVASLEGYYGTLGYHYQKWLPSFTYAHLQTTNLGDLVPLNNVIAPFQELAQDQESFNVSLDYYLNTNLVLKGGAYMITPFGGTNGLFDYNPNKKHIYMYALGLSAIF
jgi:hypothetical protein